MPNYSPDQLRKIFERLDADGSGLIDVYELQSIIEVCLRGLPDHAETHAAALRLIDEVDENHDGHVNYEEFCVGVAGGKFPGMSAAPAAAQAPPPVDVNVIVAAVEADAERKCRVAEDARAVERNERLIVQELERRKQELDAEAARAAAEAAREERAAAPLEAAAASEHEKLRQDEQRLTETQRELRKTFSAGMVPIDINNPNSLTAAYYQMDREAELSELRDEIDAEKEEVEHEKQLVAERDAAVQAEHAEAHRLRAISDHAQADAEAAQRLVDRERRLLESQHRIVVANEAEALQAQQRAATVVFSKVLDRSGSGSITLSQLHHALCDFGHSEAEIETLSHSLDSRCSADGAVTISLEDFKQGYVRCSYASLGGHS